VQPAFRLTATVLDSDDPGGLASFYEALLGWHRIRDQPEWVMLRSPDDTQGLSFAVDREYARPTWPSAPGEQRMMAHLDIAVDELAPAVERAVQLGAALAASQPQDDVRVLHDPAGHPFCLYVP
jgi:hypothetical protein